MGTAYLHFYGTALSAWPIPISTKAPPITTVAGLRGGFTNQFLVRVSRDFVCFHSSWALCDRNGSKSSRSGLGLLRFGLVPPVIFKKTVRAISVLNPGTVVKTLI